MEAFVDCFEELIVAVCQEQLSEAKVNDEHQGKLQSEIKMIKKRLVDHLSQS